MAISLIIAKYVKYDSLLSPLSLISLSIEHFVQLS